MLDDNAGAGGTENQPPPPPPAALPPAAWHADFAADPDTAAYITAKGLDKVTDWKEAFKTVAQSHRQAEQYIGAPADQLVKLPKADDPNAVRAFWQRMGAPAEPAGYDLTGVKRPDGTDLQPEFANFVRQTAADLNLPAEYAPKVAAKVLDFLQSQDVARETQAKEGIEVSRANLQKLWGPNYNANLALADQAAKRLGVDVDTAAILGEKIGADKVLEMFRKIGVASSEDTFVASPNKEGGDAPVTIVEAKQQLDQLKADKEWGAKLIAGDVPTNREYQKLMRSAYPDLYAQEGA